VLIVELEVVSQERSVAKPRQIEEKIKSKYYQGLHSRLSVLHKVIGTINRESRIHWVGNRDPVIGTSENPAVFTRRAVWAAMNMRK
jgi:hypothetical protein